MLKVASTFYLFLGETLKKFGMGTEFGILNALECGLYTLTDKLQVGTNIFIQLFDK